MSSSNAERDFDALLEYLRQNRGFDFTGYKRPSLARRVEKRMGTVGVDGFAAYIDFLEVHPEEYATLFNTILINVTSFFRDEVAWTFFAQEVLPDLIASKGTTSPIRVWSAGCASGEEAYTLLIVFAEAMGEEAFKKRVKIYATDVDEEALAKARAGSYTAREIADVPSGLARKYFEDVDDHFVMRKELRRQVIFGRHDLTSDAPISRVDVLVCRNTLMYLNAEMQSRILARFHFAMNDGGVLFLGRAESLLTHASTFEPIDFKRRISRKVPRDKLNLRDRLLLIAQNAPEESGTGLSQHLRLRDVAMDATPVAQLVVDNSGTLTLANERARTLFDLGTPEIGRPLRDLKISYRPVELRSLIDESNLTRRPILVRDVEWQASVGDSRTLELQVAPLYDGGIAVGTSVAYLDVTTARRLQRELEHAKAQLGTAHDELQSTNEELETTNEELQSTVEELETTNEELQSTNEELETMNEELQATNEELHAINDAVRERGAELNRTNDFLEAVLTSVRGAVIVLDRELHVLVWNKRAEELWGLHDGEVRGKHFLGLDIGVPVHDLRKPIKACIAKENETTDMLVDGTNRRGKPISCRVSINRMRSTSDETLGVILVMEENEAAPPLRLARP